jgi:hypothetical protein
MIVTVSVAAEDIARGKPGQCCDCPVWHAIARALPWLPRREGGYGDSFNVGPLGLCWALARIELPDIAIVFMKRFDSALSVEPFEFTLDVPGHLIPAGATA